MENHVSVQLVELLCSFAFGFIPGVIFDLFRTIRALARKSSLVINLADLFYWLVTSVLLFLFGITILTEGFRWHILLGILLGVLLYFIFISAAARKVLFAAVNAFAKFTGAIISLFRKKS